MYMYTYIPNIRMKGLVGMTGASAPPRPSFLYESRSPVSPCVLFLPFSFTLPSSSLFLSLTILSLSACPPQDPMLGLPLCRSAGASEPFEYHIPSRQSELNRRPKRDAFATFGPQSSFAARGRLLDTGR